MSSITELFAADGVLARALSDYQPRGGQIEMAAQVAAALAESGAGGGGYHVLEAGTGIGKTFAYLTPIIESGKTALISTGARALQDQLSQRDIPALARALNRNVSFTVLKGRRNYICRRAVQDSAAPNAELFDDNASAADDWQTIRQFTAQSKEGDISAISGIAADSPLLTHAVSTRESCDTQKCAYYDDCFLYKARARAQQTDIVIVNHHLFLSDMRLRDDGVAELLPSRDVVLFDEAHLLPQLAPELFGEQLSSAHLLRLIKQVERATARMSSGATTLRACAVKVKTALAALQETSEQHFADSKTPADTVLAQPDWVARANVLYKEHKALANALVEHVAPDTDYLEPLAKRALSDSKQLAGWLGDGADSTDDTAAETETVYVAGAEAETDTAGTEVSEAAATAATLSDPIVRWLDYVSASGTLTLYSAPLTGRGVFARQWAQLSTVLFTSATLSISGEFGDFCDAVGLPSDTQTRSWDSPYDFAARSLLYLPPALPAPTADRDAHTEAVVDAALPLLRANGGRAFMLFSSWRALNAAHERLQAPLQEADIDILKQGDYSDDELLRRFRASARVVLVGSKAFWQGVDIRGTALSLLIVDKIPFVPPTDPLLQARDAWRKANGENPFRRNQLPSAVLLMKQVAGRLIRDYGDYGVFLIGDPRVSSKGYGKTILSALPPFPHCRDEARAVAFLQQFRARETAPAEAAGE